MKKSIIYLAAAITMLSAASCGNNTAAPGGDSGTKGTGSAGIAPGTDTMTKPADSLTPGGDSGTKGTGSAGVTSGNNSDSAAGKSK